MVFSPLCIHRVLACLCTLVVGLSPPSPEAWQTEITTGGGEVESTLRFPLPPPDGGEIFKSLVALLVESRTHPATYIKGAAKNVAQTFIQLAGITCKLSASQVQQLSYRFFRSSEAGFLSRGVDSTMLVVGLPYARSFSMRSSSSATEESLTLSKKASPPVRW